VSERNVGGRPPRSSREAVVAAGLEVLRSEGLPAVTLSAVGERLGLGKVGLYTYVSSKEDLLLGMRDEVNRRQFQAVRREQDLPPEVALKAICSRLVELMTDYGQLMVTVEPDLVGPGMDLGEHFLDVLARLGLPPVHQLHVYLLLSSSLRGLVTVLVPNEVSAMHADAAAKGEGTARSEPGRFPRLNALYDDADARTNATPEKVVEDMVSLVIEVLVPALRKQS
jgi:AcrR family transcriptional regulator